MDHILESRPWESSDDQKEYKSSNLIFTSCKWLYSPALLSVGESPTDSGLHIQGLCLLSVQY